MLYSYSYGYGASSGELENHAPYTLYGYSYSYDGLLAVSPESRALRSWASGDEPRIMRFTEPWKKWIPTEGSGFEMVIVHGFCCQSITPSELIRVSRWIG